MKGIIIYASCYGSTRTYAEWISDATGFLAVNYQEVTDRMIEDAAVIVIGSWVLAHKLFLSKWIAEKKEQLKDKKLYVFSVSGAKPGDKVLDNLFIDSIDEKLFNNCKTYQCGGKRETKKMSFFHRMMLFIAATFIEKDKVKKEEMKRYVDNVDKKYIQPLLADLAVL